MPKTRTVQTGTPSPDLPVEKTISRERAKEPDHSCKQNSSVREGRRLISSEMLMATTIGTMTTRTVPGGGMILVWWGRAIPGRGCLS